MVNLSLTGVSETPDGPIVSLRLVDVGETTRLYAAAQFSGSLSVWRTDAAPVLLADQVQDRGNQAGTEPDLLVLDGAYGTTEVLSGGGATGDLVAYVLDAAGRFDLTRPLGRIADWTGDLQQAVRVDLGNGVQMVYGALSGQAGLGILRFEEGLLVASGLVPDTGAGHADDARGIAHADIAGQRYLFSVGGRDPGLTAWRILPDGGLVVADNLAVEEGLWISDPTALAAIEFGAETYLVLAAAGSGSLSVIGVAEDGSLRVVDHVLDDRSTRFGGVTALEVAMHAGQPWVLAGGADDGLSLFRMLPGGRLLSEGTWIHGPADGLRDINAIAAHSSGTGIDVFVAGVAEVGLTRLRVDTTAMGAVSTAGPNGAVRGTERDDVLIDGPGRDTLRGEAGADTFVLLADGQADVVADFTPFEDRLDLSGWPLLRSPAQLDMAQTVDGFRLTYGAESLTVRTADEAPFDPARLPAADLIATLRLAPQVFVGADVRPSGGEVTGTSGPDRLQASAEGQELTGLGGNDRLSGGAGRDWLFGGAGKDRLDGAGGRNLLDGGPGNDVYVYRSDLDLIAEEAVFSAGGGIDTVEAWVSYSLPANIEILRLQGDADLSGFGNAAPEVLVGNRGNNLLSGGWGEDRIVGKGGDDVIIGGPRPDELVGDGGRDLFVYNAVTDSRAGPAARDFINGFVHGIDRIDLSLIDANQRTPENDAFTFIGARAFSRRWSESAGELNYASYGGNWTIVSGDTDGNGVADFQIFVNLTNFMTGTDFIL